MIAIATLMPSYSITEYFRASADRETARLIGEKSTRVPNMEEDFTIAEQIQRTVLEVLRRELKGVVDDGSGGKVDLVQVAAGGEGRCDQERAPVRRDGQSVRHRVDRPLLTRTGHLPDRLGPAIGAHVEETKPARAGQRSPVAIQGTRVPGQHDSRHTSRGYP